MNDILGGLCNLLERNEEFNPFFQYVVEVVGKCTNDKKLGLIGHAYTNIALVQNMTEIDKCPDDEPYSFIKQALSDTLLLQGMVVYTTKLTNEMKAKIDNMFTKDELLFLGYFYNQHAALTFIKTMVEFDNARMNITPNYELNIWLPTDRYFENYGGMYSPKEMIKGFRRFIMLFKRLKTCEKSEAFQAACANLFSKFTMLIMHNQKMLSTPPTDEEMSKYRFVTCD